jgi:hypothetical protein
MKMMSAPTTDERRLFRQAMEAGAAMALGAARRTAEADREQMLQADVVGWKAPRELAVEIALHGFRIANFPVDKDYIGEGDNST